MPGYDWTRSSIFPTCCFCLNLAGAFVGVAIAFEAPERVESTSGRRWSKSPTVKPMRCATESVCGTRPFDFLTPFVFLKVLAVQRGRLSIPHVHAYWTLHHVLLDTFQEVRQSGRWGRGCRQSHVFPGELEVKEGFGVCIHLFARFVIFPGLPWKLNKYDVRPCDLVDPSHPHHWEVD